MFCLYFRLGIPRFHTKTQRLEMVVENFGGWRGEIDILNKFLFDEFKGVKYNL